MKNIERIYRGEPTGFASFLQSMTGLSPREVALIIKMGGAYLGRYRCKDEAKTVRSGDRVSAYYRLPLEMRPVSFNPDWVVADNGRILVAAKPAGLPTQGRRDADYMAFYEILKKNLKGYLGLHHRLDQGTSGLMLFARDRTLNKDIARAFRDRLVRKRYLALAAGFWPFDKEDVLIDEPIGSRTGRHGTRYLVTRDGRAASTRIRRLGEEDGLVLLSATPLTGRTHQIRVHLSHHGIPLWGDVFYGGPPGSGFLLHCHVLGWPETGRLARDEYVLAVPEHWRDLLPKPLFQLVPKPEGGSGC